ncbi:MAG: hypothetical protein PWR26_520, partial [Methanosarcinales archaeon]|nr:hypothetical protein [Methanosarcinales archaeon]
YSTAIYHLQQAVEKFIKAYMLMFFGLSKKVVKDYVGHDSPKAFLKLLEKFKISLNLISALTERVYELNSQMLKISSQDIRKLENIVNKNRKQIAEMSSEEIRNAIKLTVRLKEVLENKETKDEVSKFLATLKRELGKIEASDEYERNIASKITTLLNKILENLELSFKMYSNFLVLYTLSIITYPHATFARYPNERLPIEKYDENLGIIQCFGEITDLLEGVINSWKESPRYRGRY